MRPKRCRLLPIMVAGVLAAGTAFADVADTRNPGIPAGQDDLMADMLGRGVTLPGECRFSGGHVGGATIFATYTCATGQVAIELQHAEDNAPGLHTGQFTITAHGTLAPGFIDALVTGIRAREAAFQWTRTRPPTRLETALLISLIVFPTAAVFSGCVALARIVRRRRLAGRPVVPSSRAVRVRVAGVVLIALIGVANAATGRGSWIECGSIFVGSVSVAAFLWLTLSGAFGHASLRRRDWIGLVPLAVAFVVREGLTVHSLQEIDVQFATRPVGRHSVVYPLFQLFFAPIVHDPQSFTMHMNGVLGALACLSVYAFVKQRLESPTAGFLCSVFLALHPLVARFSPTDGPYSLLLFCWFSGLALLSTPDLRPTELFAGTVLLGIAATSRIEGSVLMVGSLLMLDWRSLSKAIGRDPWTAVTAVLTAGALAAFQMYFLLSFQLDGHPALVPLLPRWFDAVLATLTRNGQVFLALVLVGAASGLMLGRWLGFFAFAAMVIVIAPVADSSSPITLHRWVPACALQAILAGIGAYTLTAWMQGLRKWRWLAAVPGGLVALCLFLPQRGELSKPYVFTEEYDLVRSHLGPGRLPGDGCALMTFNADIGGDSDVHDFAPVAPGVRVFDCRHTDCLPEVANYRCAYYVRTAACYYQPSGVAFECDASGMARDGDPTSCMNEASASFERAVELDPIELRKVDLRATFPDPHFPQGGEIGLFRVRRPASEPAASAARSRNPSPGGP